MNAFVTECLNRRHHKISGVRAALAEDLRRYMTKSPENVAAGTSFRERASAFLTPELLTMFFHRVSHYFYVNGWKRSATLVGRCNLLLHKAQIAPQSCIGPACRLAHPAGTTFFGVGGRDLTIYSTAICCPREHDFGGPAESGPRLGDRVTVGGQAVLLGPIHVATDAKIAYGVCLDHDAPAGVLVVSPAIHLTVSVRNSQGS